MRFVFPFAALAAAGISIWPDIHSVPADSELCKAGLCRFDQVFASIDEQGIDLANVATLLRQDPMNPMVWCVYAELLAARGHTDAAAEVFTHAIALGPGMSPVLMRAANFDFAYGRTRHGIGMAHEILMQTDAFDEIIFADLLHSGLPVPELLDNAVPVTQRAAREWLAWVRAHGTTQDLSTTWPWIRQNGLADHRTAADLAWALWERKSFRKAQEVWAEWLGPTRKEYLNPERLANTRFEEEPDGSPFNWTLAPPASVQLKRGDGLRLRFSGTENVDLSQIHQCATVYAGSYRLSIEVSTDGLTTDQRPFFRIFDTASPARLNVETAPLPETMQRSWITLDFNVPAGTEAVQVQMERRPSRRFDNKIAGTVQIYQVLLVPRLH